MTTIAFDGKSLSADGRIADTAIHSDRYEKIFRWRGKLYGIAGHASHGESLKKWLKAGKRGDKPDATDTTMLIIDPDGTAWISDDCGEPLKVDAPTAIGSGRDHAMTAMDLGCNSAEAVQMAMKRDPNTGGQIRTLKLARKR